MSKVSSYKQLRVWQEGINVVNDIYELTKHFPKSELYGLTSQMRRAAVSIPSNIAEGFKRRHKKEFQHFLSLASGSVAELETQLIISEHQGLIDEDTLQSMLEKLDYLSRMITKLINSL